VLKFVRNCIHVVLTSNTMRAKDQQSNTGTWKSIQIEYSTLSIPQNQSSHESDLLYALLALTGAHKLSPCFVSFQRVTLE